MHLGMRIDIFNRASKAIDVHQGGEGLRLLNNCSSPPSGLKHHRRVPRSIRRDLIFFRFRRGFFRPFDLARDRFAGKSPSAKVRSVNDVSGFASKSEDVVSLLTNTRPSEGGSTNLPSERFQSRRYRRTSIVVVAHVALE